MPDPVVLSEEEVAAMEALVEEALHGMAERGTRDALRIALELIHLLRPLLAELNRLEAENQRLREVLTEIAEVPLVTEGSYRAAVLNAVTDRARAALADVAKETDHA